MGKARSSRNAWKHGERAEDTERIRRRVTALLAELSGGDRDGSTPLDGIGSGR